jgi:hypothetical protein
MPNDIPVVPSDGVDPNVVLPPSVIKAREASAAAHAAAYGGNDPNNPGAPDPNAPPPNGAPSGDPPPNRQGEPPAGDPPPSELPELNADGTPNWEARFKTLKGRFDAETRRSRETIGQFEERMRGMAQEMAKLQRPQLPGEQEMPPLITDKDKADYGEDLIDVIKRAALEAVMPQLKPLAQTVGQVQARVDTTATETERQFLHRMHSSMDASVPGWAELNRDPNFIAWTKQADVYSGQNRQELLQKAWYQGDSARVAAFFRGYLAEEAAIDPAAAEARQRALAGHEGHAAPPGAPPANGQQQPQPRVTLEQLAAPGRARAGATAPAGKPVWTAAGISQFYQDVANGKFRGREAERAATEADLMAAQREGRIQYNPRTATHVARQ